MKARRAVIELAVRASALFPGGVRLNHYLECHLQQRKTVWPPFRAFSIAILRAPEIAALRLDSGSDAGRVSQHETAWGAVPLGDRDLLSSSCHRFLRGRRSSNGGFTAVQFLIVLALVAVLAAISIPSYRDYTGRSQVSEGIQTASALKAAIAEYYAQHSAWPPDIGALQLTPGVGEPQAAFVGVRNGTIILQMAGDARPGLAGGRLSLRPTIDPTGSVVWSCGYAPDEGLDPPSGASAPAETTIKAAYLPSSCR